MKQRLPKNVFKALKKTIAEGKELDSSIADVVASAMKDWAIEKGATHYTHWFQPMTGITAEKHDSFISPMGDGTVIILRQGAYQGRARRVQLPVRRYQSNVRGKRLYRMGSYLLCIRKGRFALYPDRILFLLR